MGTAGIQSQVGNQIMSYLEEYGMTGCNPVATPITKTMVQKLYKNKHNGLQQTVEDQFETDSIIGKMQWLGQTTHCTLAVALSIYSSILSTDARVAGGLEPARMIP